MDSIEKQERKREAMRRLGTQRRRVGDLRRRVIAGSLIAFVLLWGVVFAQMATGNDPVLGNSSSTIATGQRGGAHRQANAKALPPEADAGTDSEEAGAAPGAAATEAIETTEPSETETEVLEPEPVEAEVAELEPEPEPVLTSQS
jgi:hypothetical protein